MYEAYKAVKSNGGAAGVDGQTIEQFEADLKGNLYKIWNRMSSGSYFPPPVRAVSIPKKSGGERILGVPTVSDRSAQMVVKQLIEPDLEPVFLPDSYGYRPGKSALDAVGVTRKRCWTYDWVLEFDIKGLFDNIDHELLLKAVRKHVTCEWALLYIERWLTAPMEKDGSQDRAKSRNPARGRDQPDPGQSVPALHVRPLDDADTPRPPVVPVCGRRAGALPDRARSGSPQRPSFRPGWRSAAWKCIRPRPRSSTARTESAEGAYPNVTFDFLGYCFRPRLVMRLAERATVLRLHSRGQPLGVEIHAGEDPGLEHPLDKRSCRWTKSPNSSIRSCGVDSVLRTIRAFGAASHATTTSIRRSRRWAMRKFKRFAAHKVAAAHFLEKIARDNARISSNTGESAMTGTFACDSHFDCRGTRGRRDDDWGMGSATGGVRQIERSKPSYRKI